MNFKDNKLEFSAIYLIISVIFGVGIWFVLNLLDLKNTVEIASIITISAIAVLLALLSYNKGNLPTPSEKSLIYKMSKNKFYSREKIRPYNYTRQKYSSIIKTNYHKFRDSKYERNKIRKLK